MVLVALVVTTASPRVARADSMNNVDKDVQAFLLFLGAMVAIFVADTYYTVLDASEAGQAGGPQHSDAVAEAALGGGQTAIFAGISALVGAAAPSDTFIPLAAMGWPLGMTMHAAWGLRGSPYQGLPGEAIPMLALGGALLAYDAESLIVHRSPSFANALAESVGSLPAFVFGTATIARQPPHTLPLTVGLTSIPTVLLGHSIFAFYAAGQKHSPTGEHKAVGPDPSQSGLHLSFVPTLTPDGRGPVVGLHALGAF